MPTPLSAKGGAGGDIASMKAGELHFATEGMKAPEKVATPLCLARHPPHPLSQQEVVERARRSRAA